jgi:hypothetical protein
MIVIKITEEQKDILINTEFSKDSIFNPIQDKNGNYIISLEEVEQCHFEWVKNLPLIKHEPIEIKILP